MQTLNALQAMQALGLLGLIIGGSVIAVIAIIYFDARSKFIEELKARWGESGATSFREFEKSVNIRELLAATRPSEEADENGPDKRRRPHKGKLLDSSVTRKHLGLVEPSDEE